MGRPASWRLTSPPQNLAEMCYAFAKKKEGLGAGQFYMIEWNSHTTLIIESFLICEQNNQPLNTRFQPHFQ